MATQKQVTEPATPAVVEQVTEPARTFDPKKKVKVIDKKTKQVLERPVPENWLDGRFPQLELAPSEKGK